MKKCSVCGIEKPLDEFYPRKDRKCGVRSQCIMCDAAYAKKYGKKNRQRLSKYNEEYRKNNAEKISKMRAEYRKKHKERIAIEYRKWQDENLDKKRASCNLRRALYNSAPGKFTDAEFEILCNQYNNRCVRCGEERPLTADHVVPLSKGGSNYIENIQPLCLSCNSKKGTRRTDYRSKFHEKFQLRLF